MPAHRLCPLCDSDNSTLAPSRFSQAEWVIKDCPCGMVYLENAPAYEALEETFAWEKTAAAETERRQTAEPVVQTVSKAVVHIRKKVSFGDKLTAIVEGKFPDGPVVDIGCAKGGVLRRISAPEVIGIEISKELAKKAKANLKHKQTAIIQADALTGMKRVADRSVAGVIMSAFLEHEQQPSALLKEVARALKPEGLAVIKVPNYGSWNRKVRGARWCGFRYPDHVNYFTPETLTKLCEKSGLRVAKFSFVDRLPTNDNMWLLVGPA